MSIERIRKDAAKADQIIEELARKGKPTDPEAQPPTHEDTPEETEAAQPEVEAQPDEGVVATAATDDQPDTGATAELRELAAKWEQRYRSLDGMIQARDRQIEQLHQLLAAMQSAKVEPAKADEPKAPAKSAISKEDEEAFGADLIDLARRVARSETGELVDTLRAEIAQLKDALSGVQRTTAVSTQERFEAQLTQLSPDWQKFDADPKFIGWLQESPSRQRVFEEAAKDMDAKGVAFFFSEFAKANGIGQPKPKQDARLEKQVAPGKPRSVPTAAKDATGDKQWTRTEIAQFYSQDRRNFTPDEYNRIERDIFKAQSEGRVDYTR